jgi:uncharacterized protein with ParB-like and HNH nuclease domain
VKADPLSVGKVLTENHRFVVPIYQRTYAWTEKRQLNPLFEQIEAKAEERLAKGKVEFPHYMGSLLVIPEGEATFGRVQAFDIVDGQQRLTTFHLSFAALREIARDRAFEDLAGKLESLLLLGTDLSESDKNSGRYKLMPTSFDRGHFRDVIDLTADSIRAKYPEHFYKNGKIKSGAPNCIAGYWFFLDRAQAFIDQDPANARNRLLALTDAIFQNFHFIVITLSKEDDPQVIFATLNTGGQPLAAMDLVRNDVFLRAARNHEDEEILMNDYWRIFEEAFWKSEATQGRIRKPIMDFFLAHVLAAESGELISLSELYAEYKKFSRRTQAASVGQELAALTRYAPIYRELIGPPVESPLYGLAKCLGNFDMSTAYPLILLIASSPAALEVKNKLYELIRSYVVRRALCGLTAKNYNIAFLEFVSSFREHGVSVESFASAAELKKNSDAAKFPTDTELIDAIATRNQYQTLPSYRLAYILEEFERASRDKFTAAEGIRSGLSIEHIMPQHWQEHWRTLPSGRVSPTEDGIPTDEAMAAEIAERNRLIHTLGNLSLLTPPANASASNSAFEEKKPRLVDALLRMNQDIAKQTHWGEPEIRNRAKELAQLAVRIWPVPSAGSTFAAKA